MYDVILSRHIMLTSAYHIYENRSSRLVAHLCYYCQVILKQYSPSKHLQQAAMVPYICAVRPQEVHTLYVKSNVTSPFVLYIWEYPKNYNF